ncbi:MAG: spore germination protein [Clostridiales bacterium]|nr:spore germination protein [Clostridiales bacterium]
MAKISSRQLYFLLACIMPVGKLILMPTHLVHDAKNDLLIPAAANILIQAGMIFIVMLLSRSNKQLYDLLDYTFGRIVAKVLTALFALFLFFAALMPLLEQKLLVQSVFYDTLPSLLVFSPFFLFSIYICATPISSFGRVWDLLAPISIVSFIGIIAFSFGSADFGALLPVGASGAKSIVSAGAYTMSWFYDSALILCLMGKFEYKKNMAWKSALFYLLGGLAILLFLAIFYGIFEELSLRQLFAFSKTSKYFSAITAMGRIDYIFIYAIALVMAYFCTLPLHAGVDCMNRAFGGNKVATPLYAVGVNLVMLVVSIVLDFNYATVSNLLTRTLFWIFPAFCVLLPLLCLLLRRSPREKRKVS